MRDNNMSAKKLADALAVALIIMMLFGIFGVTGLFSELGARIEGKESNTEISEFAADKITELEIEVATADITIAKGDTLKIESDRFGFELKEKKGKISLEERGGIFSLNKDRTVTIYIPESMTFDKVEIETGAADIEADTIRSRQLRFDIGAGSISLENLTVTEKANIDCGAGEFFVNSGSVNDLKFSLGVGSASISSVLTAEADFECGVGELNLNLPDGANNYTFEIETGLGAITLDSQRVKNGAVIGNGQNRIGIEGGVGSIDITFNK